jgi:PIF1-like helicase
MVNGQLETISQLKDYANRGKSLETLSLWEFVRDTYNGSKLTSDSELKRNKRFSDRSTFMNDTDQLSKCRVVRKAGHETMVDLVGPWLPRSERGDDYPMFCATMLALLVPWRNIGAIHRTSVSLEAEFENFLKVARPDQMMFMKNAQYYHESSDGVRQCRKDESVHPVVDPYEQIPEEGEEMIFFNDVDEVLVAEEDIQHAIDHPFGPEEMAFAQAGMNIATDLGIFVEGNVDTQLEVKRKDVSRIANIEDVEQYQCWKAIIDKIGERDNDGSILDISSELSPIASGLNGVVEPEVISNETDNKNDAEYLQVLNVEQRMAHDIVINHLDAEILEKKPPQLLMNIVGPGGTGKSTLINAIGDSFARRDVSHLFAKTALSGVAASLIGGTTLHWWAGVPSRKTPKGDNWMDRSSRTIKDRRNKNMSKPSWLVIDESGMLTKDLLAHLHQVAGSVRTGDGRADATIALGGLNTILTGDFHQFPPVGQPDVALYRSEHPRQSSIVGENIYNQFETVVELVQQNRIVDARWQEILNNARTGSCTEADIEEINKLVLTREDCEVPDFSSPPWKDVRLVTPRNSMRKVWNAAKLREHCKRSGEILYVVDAEDTVGKERRALTAEERLTVAQMNVADTARLENRLELAIGMEAMVTQNIATDASLANGSRGIVKDVVLDPREEWQEAEEGVIWLKYPPAMILFEPYRKPTIDPLPGLLPNQVPVLPFEDSFYVGGKKKRTKVIRRQMPLTPAYAFTDHKSQGQTLGCVLIDIGYLSRFPVNAFAAYVALSRSRGRHTIRLLREFDERLFTTHPSRDLMEEDKRLHKAAEETRKKWEAGVYNYK